MKFFDWGGCSKELNLTGESEETIAYTLPKTILSNKILGDGLMKNPFYHNTSAMYHNKTGSPSMHLLKSCLTILSSEVYMQLIGLLSAFNQCGTASQTGEMQITELSRVFCTDTCTKYHTLTSRNYFLLFMFSSCSCHFD